jgi:DHA2 family multidrug resistance protein
MAKIPRAALLIVITAGLASLLELVDTSIVNVAIPTMMGNLGATLDEISWVVTGYIIANAIVLPLAGWLSVRLGRRLYYIGCIGLFTLASVACGFAPNLMTLVAFRIVQGLAGGALLPTSQALIQEAFPPEEVGLASAIYGMVVIIGPTIGPPLGGYLTDHMGWRSIFNINLPLGLLAGLMAFANVSDFKLEKGSGHDKVRSQPIDVWGLAFLVIAIGCLQFVLERGQVDDWFASKVIMLNSLLAAAAAAAFVWWELKVAHPIVNLRLFKKPILRYGTMMMGALGFILYGIIFFIPVFCSVNLGLTATETGLLFMPGALASGFCMPIVGVQLRKRDPRLLVAMGVGVVCTAMALLAYSSSSTGSDQLFLPLLLRGFGMAFLFVPLNAVVLGSFTGPTVGEVAGITNLARQLGGSLGIALLSTLFNRATTRAYGEMIGKVSRLNINDRAGFAPHGMAMQMGMASPAQLAAKAAWFRVQRQAFVQGFDHMMWFMVFAFALALVPLYFMESPAHLGPVDAH